MSIKKGVILAAGLGTRLLPFTKYLPKPMIPVANRPAIDFIIEEALNSGIEEIGIVCNYLEDIIINHFKENKSIKIIHQSNTWGTSYALKSATDFISNDDFCLFLADEIIISQTPCVKQLIHIFEENTEYVVTGLETVSKESLLEYNVVSLGEIIKPNQFMIDCIIEKPSMDSIFPSSYTSIGRYVIPNTFLNNLSDLKDNPQYEIPLTHYFQEISNQGLFCGYQFEGKRYDVGTLNKWMKSNIDISKKLFPNV